MPRVLLVLALMPIVAGCGTLKVVNSEKAMQLARQVAQQAAANTRATQSQGKVINNHAQVIRGLQSKVKDLEIEILRARQPKAKLPAKPLDKESAWQASEEELEAVKAEIEELKARGPRL